MSSHLARALFLVLVLCVASRAQTASRPESLPTSSSLDARLEKIRARHNLPALGAAATTGDRLLVVGATGVRKLGSPERVTALDRWHLGSCTKSMTATMLARLVDRGKLSWDLTIGDAFRDEIDRIHADFRPVTIEQLLAHRGGVPSDLSADGLWGRLWQRKGTTVDQREELFEGVVAHAPTTRPGTAFLYANAGFAIAGHAAELLMKKPWEDLMRDELFQPLGMKSAGFGAPGEPGAMTEPWGHHGAESKPVEPGPNADNPPAIGPGGTVHCSLADWAKYAALHLRGAAGKSDYLKPETFARIQARPKVGEYAFGWGHTDRPWANGHVLTHNGSNTSWFCVVWIAPNRDVAYLATCNAGGNDAAAATDEAIGALMAEVGDRLLPQEASPRKLDWLPDTSDAEKEAIEGHVRDLFDESHPAKLAVASAALATIGKKAIPRLLSEFVGLDVTKEADIRRGNAIDQTLVAMIRPDFDMGFDPATFPSQNAAVVVAGRARAIRRWFGWWEQNKDRPLPRDR